MSLSCESHARPSFKANRRKWRDAKPPALARDKRDGQRSRRRIDALPLRAAVIVPAAKLPEPSRRTMAVGVLTATALLTAVVVLIGTALIVWL